MLRKEKEAYAATKKKLAETKELAELSAMTEVGDGRAYAGREEVQAADERVREPGDAGASLVHHTESDDGMVRLLPHVGYAEATQEEGKLEAFDAVMGDTELRIDDGHNAMDVGHGTGDNV